jgi:hypothetical protein
VKYMLLIYGNEEAFSSVGAETFAEIVRETDALNQELFESGELVGRLRQPGTGPGDRGSQPGGALLGCRGPATHARGQRRAVTD